MKAQELCDAIGRVDEFLGTVPLEDARPIAVTDWGLVHAAASSWAALAWRKGAERPERAGWYLTGEADSDQFDPTDDFSRGASLNVLLWDGATWNAGDPAPAWWCPLVFPTVPEATDEG